MKEFRDLTNMTFGLLTVIGQADDYVGPSGRHRRKWWCQCSCGSAPKAIIECNLTTKNHPIRSCGCLAKAAHKKYNKYDLSGKYGIGWTGKGEEFYFDLDDYEKIKDYCWYFDNRYLKAIDIARPGSYKRIRMHRLIIDCPDNLEPNHKNHNTLDNRKENLEIVMHQENMAKRRPSSEWNFKKRNDNSG